MAGGAGHVNRMMLAREELAKLHVPCALCGYDLYGLHPDHRCPECSTAAWLSYSSGRLLFVSPCLLLFGMASLTALAVHRLLFNVPVLGRELWLWVLSHGDVDWICNIQTTALVIFSAVNLSAALAILGLSPRKILIAACCCASAGIAAGLLPSFRWAPLEESRWLYESAIYMYAAATSAWLVAWAFVFARGRISSALWLPYIGAASLELLQPFFVQIGALWWGWYWDALHRALLFAILIPLSPPLVALAGALKLNAVRRAAVRLRCGDTPR